MALFIIALSLITVIHFIYDGIILPSIRQHLRNKLFELRDELRWLKINGIGHADNQAFELVHDAINTLANRLPMLTLTVKESCRREIHNNSQLQQAIERRINVMKHCENAEIQRIYTDMNRIIDRAFIANAGGWLIYIVPIVILFGTLKKLVSISTEIAMMPSYYMNKLIPHTDRSAWI